MDERAYPELDNEIEIDLIDLFWELLMQWKPIALSMLLCGCLLMPLMYARSVRSYRAQVAANESMTARLSGETEEEVAVLGEEEQEAVDAALLTNRQMLEVQYILDSTVRYWQDPGNIRSLWLFYRLHTEEPGTIAVLQDAYVSRFSNPDVQQQIADAYGMTDLGEAAQMVLPSVNATSSAEMRQTRETDGSVFVSAIVLEDTDVEAVSRCLQSVVREYRSELASQVAPHTMTLLAEENRVNRDTTIISERISLETQLAGFESAIKTAEAAFSDEQKQVYEYQLAKLREEFGVAEEVDEEEQILLGEAADGAVAESDSIEESLSAPSMNPKYFVLGMLLGAFLYAGIYVVWWVISPRVRQSQELVGAMGIRAIGEVRSYPAVTPLQKFFRDKWVYDLRYKERLADKPQVVLISFAGKTPYKAVWRLFAACRNYGAKMMGHILIESY